MARLISMKLVKALNNMNLQRISSVLSLKLLLRPMLVYAFVSLLRPISALVSLCIC
jgi:hypothetical protein